jgi:hypothetical protein
MKSIDISGDLLDDLTDSSTCTPLARAAIDALVRDVSGKNLPSGRFYGSLLPV